MILTNVGALERSFNGADVVGLGFSFGVVTTKLRRKLSRRVAGHSMDRTGKRPEEKIQGGEGAPRPSGSAASSFTAQGVDGSAQKGRVGGGEPSHPQMPKSASADSCPQTAPRSFAAGRADGDRVHSHGRASTSPRCGFKWVSQHLEEALTEKRHWDDYIQEGGFDDQHYSRHCVEIAKSAIRHVIGVRGRMLRKIEDFCGIFITLHDAYDDICEVNLLGLPYACILGAFIVEMLGQGYYSIVESLIRHGW